MRRGAIDSADNTMYSNWPIPASRRICASSAAGSRFSRYASAYQLSCSSLSSQSGLASSPTPQLYFKLEVLAVLAAALNARSMSRMSGLDADDVALAPGYLSGDSYLGPVV
jgi:hypothetical protein